MTNAKFTPTCDGQRDRSVLQHIQSSVVDYYRHFLEGMTRDESACPELFRTGASSMIGALYGEGVRSQVECAGAVSLGCGNPLKAANLTMGEIVLDLGCGPGLDCILAGQAVGDSGRVVGIDLVESMVSRAAVTTRRIGQSHVDMIQAAMERIPLRSGSVDVVISNCAVNLSVDKSAVLQEVARVLRSGGRLVFYDILSEVEVSDVLRSDLRRWSGCVSGALTAKDYLGHLYDAGLRWAEIREVASADGFVERVTGAPRLYVGQVVAQRP